MTRLSTAELDKKATRLAELDQEADDLREELKRQVDEFGFTPARAEKSKRLVGDKFQFTLTQGTTTEVKDAEVERIKDACPVDIFAKLFKQVTRYKLSNGATAFLAGILPEHAPRNLRQMFSRAVETTTTAPRLRIEPAKA